MVSDNDAFPKVVVLWSASVSEHLKHILRRELDPTTLFGVVNLSTFDDGRMGRQINTPSKSCGTNEDLNGAIGEQLFDKTTVLSTFQHDEWQIQREGDRVGWHP